LAIRVRRIMYLAYTLYMAPLISNDLKSKEKDKKSRIANSILISVLTWCRMNLTIIITSSRSYHRYKTNFRNGNPRVQCDNPQIFASATAWRRKFLWSWISTCQLINQTEATNQLGRMFNQMYDRIDALRGQTELFNNWIRENNLQPDQHVHQGLWTIAYHPSEHVHCQFRIFWPSPSKIPRQSAS
jgi:hypothetical protein